MANTKSVEGNSLLDETTILFGSGMGNGNAHTNSDLPILMAGNRHRTGKHQILPSTKSKRVPLSNLYLSILQDMGIEDDVFAHSNGTLTI